VIDSLPLYPVQIFLRQRKRWLSGRLSSTRQEPGSQRGFFSFPAPLVPREHTFTADRCLSATDFESAHPLNLRGPFKPRARTTGSPPARARPPGSFFGSRVSPSFHLPSFFHPCSPPPVKLGLFMKMLIQYNTTVLSPSLFSCLPVGLRSCGPLYLI